MDIDKQSLNFLKVLNKRGRLSYNECEKYVGANVAYQNQIIRALIKNELITVVHNDVPDKWGHHAEEGFIEITKPKGKAVIEEYKSKIIYRNIHLLLTALAVIISIIALLKP